LKGIEIMFGESVLKRIKRLFRSYKRGTFVSFKRPLAQTIDLLKPHSVVEFGPGHSTRLFLKHSNSEIWSFETSLKWFDEYKYEFDDDRCHLVYKESGWSLDEIYDYVKSADLVFVDGGDRPQALKFAYDLIEENGVVYLHDAHREDYEEGILTYPYRYFPERHSCILCKNEELFKQIRSSIKADYSCNCKYCSSHDRRAYFSRISQLG
jgi:hypothetical protein